MVNDRGLVHLCLLLVSEDTTVHPEFKTFRPAATLSIKSCWLTLACSFSINCQPKYLALQLPLELKSRLLCAALIRPDGASCEFVFRQCGMEFHSCCGPNFSPAMIRGEHNGWLEVPAETLGQEVKASANRELLWVIRTWRGFVLPEVFCVCSQFV